MPKLLSCELEDLSVASDSLKTGGLVSFPTETVYGLGANAYSDKAVLRIYMLKNRPPVNPLIAHYKSADEALFTDVIPNKTAIALAERFWPGPMTLVLNKKPSSRISRFATAELKTLAVRVPDNAVCHSLLDLLTFPLVAPSANKSTTLSTTTAEAVFENFSDYEGDLSIIDGGKCKVGIESTIIDVSDEENISVLRYGVLTKEEIETVCEIRERKDLATKKPVAPGMMFKHYAPCHPIKIGAVECNQDDAYLDFGGAHKDLEKIAKSYLDLSPSGNLCEAASNLFQMLRVLDKSDCSRIVVAPIANNGVGLAINDKLRRAAGLIG